MGKRLLPLPSQGKQATLSTAYPGWLGPQRQACASKGNMIPSGRGGKRESKANPKAKLPKGGSSADNTHHRSGARVYMQRGSYQTQSKRLRKVLGPYWKPWERVSFMLRAPCPPCGQALGWALLTSCLTWPPSASRAGLSQGNEG